MLKVGITGGIGSGKSLICQIFAMLGIPIYNADQRAKFLMSQDEVLIRQIKSAFGDEAYLSEGQLNRPYLATIVFSDPDKLQQLNGLVHPAVNADANSWHQSQTGVPYTLKEAALLFESGSYKDLDQIITVFAPKKLRIQRVMARDKVDRKQVIARMDQQMPEREKVRRADYVIYNNEKRPVITQVYKIHHQLLRLIDAKKK